MELYLKNNPDRMRLLVQKVFNIQRARGKTNDVIGEISCPSWQRDKGHEGHEWTRRDLLIFLFALMSWDQGRGPRLGRKPFSISTLILSQSPNSLHHFGLSDCRIVELSNRGFEMMNEELRG